MIDTVGFLGLLDSGKKDNIFRLGTMSGGYVTFDGETVASGKTYAKLGTISNGRVLMAKIGGTYIVLGNIT